MKGWFSVCNVPRHSIQCILPPHILLNLARNGNEQERDFALRTLSLDSTFRSARSTQALMGGLKPATASVSAATTSPAVQRTIYDDRQTQTLPGTLVRSEGQSPVQDT